MKGLPIPVATDEQKQTLETLVDQIIELKKQGDESEAARRENQIDEIVFALYDLTPDEIAIVKGESTAIATAET